MKIGITAFMLLTVFQLNVNAQNKKMPSVTLTDLKGNKVNTTDYFKPGKIYVIDFWATWCGPCIKSLNNITPIYNDWTTKYNTEVVAISIDDPQSMNKVSSQVSGSRWPFPVLLDPNQELKRALDFQNVPFSFIVDQNGDIVFSHSGYVNGDELTIQDKIKALSQKKSE